MTTAAGRLVWMHQVQDDKLDAAASRAWAIAQKEAWAGTTDRVAMVRIWLASIMVAISKLGPTPPELVTAVEGGKPFQGTPGSKLYVQTTPSDTNVTARDWQNQLAAGVIALATGHGKQPGEIPGIADGHVLTIQTTDGRPAVQNTSDTAQIGIVEGVVIVLVAGAVASACAWIATTAAEAFSNALAIDANKQKLVETMTTSAKIIEDHTAAEAKAGAPIAYQPAEIETLQTLNAVVKGAADWQPPPLMTAEAAAGAVTEIGHAGAGAVSNAGLIVPLAIAGVLLLFASASSRGRQALAA